MEIHVSVCMFKFPPHLFLFLFATNIELFNKACLAIVGVLFVAGIAVYPKAMAKYKANKLVDQISTIAANVRTTFAGQGNYKGLSSSAAYKLGVFPDDMIKDCDLNGAIRTGVLKKHLEIM